MSKILSMKTKTTGGRNLKRALGRVRQGGVHSVQVGFFSDAVNTRGQPLTNIAANNEFGARRDDGLVIPERPFMRKANQSMRDDVKKVISDRIDPATLAVDAVTAAAVGETMKAKIQESIVGLTNPANAPITRARKGGNSPLVDSGDMHDAVRYEVIDS